MTNPAETQKIELQRPDLGIETVQPGPNFGASTEDYPWISADMEVPTALITMEDGTQFNYGSLVGGNGALVKLAEKVPDKMSESAEQGLFKSVSRLLVGEQHPNVDHVPDQLSREPMFKVGKSGRDAPRLFFTIVKEADKLPTVLRIGIVSHKKQGELASIVTSRVKSSYKGK
jgi:hypothetical protein